jgi:DNA-binding XRE family transcriptional regulator
MAKPDPSSRPERLLYTRAQAAELLGGVNKATVVALEKSGRLAPVRLTGRPTGQVFYKRADVLRLAQAEAD